MARPKKIDKALQSIKGPWGPINLTDKEQWKYPGMKEIKIPGKKPLTEDMIREFANAQNLPYTDADIGEMWDSIKAFYSKCYYVSNHMATLKAREIERVEAALKMLQKQIDELLPYLIRALVIVDTEESGNICFDEYKAYFEALAKIGQLADKLIGKLEPRKVGRPPTIAERIFNEEMNAINKKRTSKTGITYDPIDNVYSGPFYGFMKEIYDVLGKDISPITLGDKLK